MWHLKPDDEACKQKRLQPIRSVSKGKRRVLTHPDAMKKIELVQIAVAMAVRLKVEGKRYRFKRKRYDRCFKGSDFVDEMIRANFAIDRNAAIIMGTRMAKLNILQCLSSEKGMRDDGKYYRFFWDVLKYELESNDSVEGFDDDMRVKTKGKSSRHGLQKRISKLRLAQQSSDTKNSDEKKPLNVKFLDSMYVLFESVSLI